MFQIPVLAKRRSSYALFQRNINIVSLATQLDWFDLRDVFDEIIIITFGKESFSSTPM
jgi:hypothetical protein